MSSLKTSALQRRSRGRPTSTEQHVNEMRLQIATHALDLYRQEGYGAVSMRRLAQATGCTVKTLYRYFERKIDVLRYLWARVFETLFDELGQIAALHPDPVARLEAVALGYVRFWLENRDQYFMVFMSSNVDQSDVSIFVHDDAILARFAIFQRGIADASPLPFNDAETRLRSELLMCALNGISHNMITISGYPWSSPDKLVHAAVRNLIIA